MVRSAVPSSRMVAYIRSKAESAMRTQVVIKRPSNPVFNSATGLMTAGTEKVVYTGMARIYPVRGGSRSSVGEQTSVSRSTNVSIPVGAAVPRVEDLITVIMSLDDPALNGKQLRVMDVAIAGLAVPVHTMSCTNIEANPFWTEA